GKSTEPGLRDNDIADDAWLFEGQLVGTYHLSKSLSATVAPAIMFYNAAHVSHAVNENAFTDVPPTVQPSGDLAYLGETRNLAILTAPGDVSFKLWNVPTKFYWDFAWNARGRRRGEEIYKETTHDETAFITAANGIKVPINTHHNGEDDFAYLL